MTISADNFWIELDRLLGASATTAAQIAALMELRPRWPDIHDRAIQSPDHFKSLTKALVISRMTAGSPGEDRFARGVTCVWLALNYLPAMSLLSSRTRSAPTGFIEPCLPSPADKPPAGSNWIYEIKHDGYRPMARRDAVGIDC